MMDRGPIGIFRNGTYNITLTFRINWRQYPCEGGMCGPPRGVLKVVAGSIHSPTLVRITWFYLVHTPAKERKFKINLYLDS